MERQQLRMRLLELLIGNCVIWLEIGVVPEDRRSSVIVPFYKGKGERTEWKNYRSLSWLEKWKIYGGILVDNVCRVIEGLLMMSNEVLDQVVGETEGVWDL